MLLSDTVLTHFDPTKRINVVLSHIEQNGVEWPICYASQTMTKAEQNYSQLEHESLSIIFGISKFHDYLWGHHFVIETDHQPLVKILGECTGIPTIASSCLERWALKFAAHTYVISFRKGVSHTNTDLFSRLPAEHTEAAGPSEGMKVQKLQSHS